MRRIICIGNRFDPRDSAGPRVFDQLTSMDLPAGVEVIDGGLAGLNLLRFFDDADRIVLVDAVTGCGTPGEVIVLAPEEVIALEEGFGHGAGLPYLLQVLRASGAMATCDVMVVGLEGRPDEHAIERAARISLKLLTQASAQTEDDSAALREIVRDANQ